eukprot:NODE_2069_length_1700_cov_49.635384_g1770_i0.p1 GENE.NODE_2069_length_1700_cov_49.635384_g1770_i0~~NODE_2069_length_1700_cov_49.635384_g1770_i0.p1  ORF type:complete len:482 (-),score=97.76 NODE_2069_length_1700_cov_49.635384_g1770_i0:162-1607(-)
MSLTKFYTMNAPLKRRELETEFEQLEREIRLRQQRSSPNELWLCGLDSTSTTPTPFLSESPFYTPIRPPDPKPKSSSYLAPRTGQYNRPSSSSLSYIRAAIRRGDIELIESVLCGNPVIVSQKEDGATLLHWACKGGQVNVARLLLYHGADPNLPDDTGATALYSSTLLGNISLVQLLLNAKADSKAVNTADGYTALYMASLMGNDGIVTALIQASANINYGATEVPTTPLYAAVNSGHSNVAKILLNAGANVDIPSTDKLLTPLHSACQQGDRSMVHLLVERAADVNAVTVDGRTPLQICRSQQQLFLTDYLIQHGARDQPQSGLIDLENRRLLSIIRRQKQECARLENQAKRLHKEKTTLQAAQEINSEFSLNCSTPLPISVDGVVFPEPSTLSSLDLETLEELCEQVRKYKELVKKARDKLRQEEKERSLCVICMDRKCSILLMPCTHQQFCDLCTLSLTSCPLCRAPIQNRIKPFSV